MKRVFAAKARNILVHLDRLEQLRAVQWPEGLGHAVHQGRLTELAREGAQMSAQHLRDLDLQRRHATLVALVLDLHAAITDQILEMHDRVVGHLFADAKRKHEQRFAAAGNAINDKVRLYARVGHALIAPGSWIDIGIVGRTRARTPAANATAITTNHERDPSQKLVDLQFLTHF